MLLLADRIADTEPTAIRTHLGAIFVSLELSRSAWLITSRSPGNGGKRWRQAGAAGECGCDVEVCGPAAEGVWADRQELPDHYDPGGGAGRVLAAPRAAAG